MKIECQFSGATKEHEPTVLSSNLSHAKPSMKPANCTLAKKKLNYCKGYKLELNGSLPFTSYPFGLHPLLDLQWTVFVDDNSLTL